jgi:hypothetical protein
MAFPSPVFHTPIMASGLSAIGANEVPTNNKKRALNELINNFFILFFYNINNIAGKIAKFTAYFLLYKFKINY